MNDSSASRNSFLLSELVLNCRMPESKGDDEE